MQANIKQLNRQDYQLSYSVYGKGTPVVLLHGYGEDSQIWLNQIAHLSAHCLLIVPDLPGSGKSSITAKGLDEWLPNMSIDSLAQSINQLLIAENVSACILLGHSMGGYIGLAFAELYPSKLLGLGLVHSTAFADNNEKKIVRQKSIQFIAENGGSAFFKTSMPNLFGKKFKENQAHIIEQLINQSKNFESSILIGYTRAMMNRPDRSTVLGSANFPILFIAGPEDIAAPLKDVQEQATLPNKSYLTILDGVGHMGMLEAPHEMNLHLTNFIQLV
ncbi:alpha/beta fold hydrolase [Sediminibacterium sp.]|uniref:alpha/beta fold hydrolase n=1 Tax=Sediminibacterium sp. TaxID=1917865 RepID=UPI003F72C0F1